MVQTNGPIPLVAQSLEMLVDNNRPCTSWPYTPRHSWTYKSTYTFKSLTLHVSIGLQAHVHILAYNTMPTLFEGFQSNLGTLECRARSTRECKALGAKHLLYTTHSCLWHMQVWQRMLAGTRW